MVTEALVPARIEHQSPLSRLGSGGLEGEKNEWWVRYVYMSLASAVPVDKRCRNPLHLARFALDFTLSLCFCPRQA